MGFQFDRKRALKSALPQLIIIVVAFAIMVSASFVYNSRIEKQHLINAANSALSATESQIFAAFLEPETFLTSFSETIRTMIINGQGIEHVTRYITTITNFLLNESETLTELIDIYGYFHIWDNMFISGRNIEPPSEFSLRNSHWYISGVAAKGSVTASIPYTNIEPNNQVLTFSRLIYDTNGEPIGVICLDLNLTRVLRLATNIKLSDNSYGMLLNSNIVIIAHPSTHLVGRSLYTIPGSVADIATDLENGIPVNERIAVNYRQEKAITFFRPLKFNWHLGIVIPVSEYYSSIHRMAFFLITLGILLASAICYMLYRISSAKLKADIRNQQKSNFLATMSHEIRTPLNAIMGMTEIQMQNTSHPPSTTEAFVKINNSGNLLLGIINDILDLSKIESGKLELNPVRYDVPSLINDIIQFNYIRYDNKPIEFIIDVDETVPMTLVGDELRLKQIVNNLLSNAFKFTDQGAVTFSTSAECVGRGGAVHVALVFTISDTGQGMTSEQIDDLFGEHIQINMEANRSTEGAGLGLTITRNLVNLMQGRIQVESAIGKGTSVTVRLPQKTDGVGISGKIGKELADNLKNFKIGNIVQMKKSQVNHEHMPYGKVLIVDDVETNLYVAKGLMAPYGLNIDLATSGFEAIEKIKDGNVYDIIFMDHMMPKMDGIETTKQLRQAGYNRPIVALTANAIAGQSEVFLKSGFDGFISKPIDIRQLNVSLNKLIRDKQPIEVVEAAKRAKEEFDRNNKTSSFGQIGVDAQLADIFARDAEKSLSVMKALLENNFQTESDIQSYVINVHAMKSALANIGEMDISAKAMRLEQAGRDKNINVMLSETQGFLNELQAVIEKVKPKYEDSNVEDTEESLALLNENLEVIKTACETFDKKTAKNTISFLRSQTWSQKTKDLLNKLSEHLLHSEFDDVTAAIDEWSKN